MQWKVETGGKVIGFLLSDVPEEIIHAAGFFPYAIVGGSTNLEEANSQLQAWACSHSRSALARALEGKLDFLDGLIIHRRGKQKGHKPRPVEIPVTNNTVLKKLRVAFKLREDDIIEILKSTGFSVSTTELSALFRSEDHRNFMRCGDQLLRYFLKGLSEKYKK